MEQTELEQFLDTGWMNGGQLFYNDKAYWTDCLFENGEFVVIVFCSPAEKVSKEEYRLLPRSGAKAQWVQIYECADKTEEEARISFLRSPLFDGKSFWEVADEIEWLEHA